MQHFYELRDVKLDGAWLTIGAFDGIHLGHRKVISQLTAGAHPIGAPAVVLTFYPHPSTVLRGPRESFYLTTPEEKAALLAKAGIDVVITHPFNEDVAGIKAKDFVNRIHEHLAIKQMWVGHDFALGHNREGDVSVLKKFGEELGFSVQTIEAFRMGGEVVSSSRIRGLLEVGQVGPVAELLGRSYSIRGIVEYGEGRGRSIGIPTANLAIAKERVVPGAGVYACYVTLNGKEYQAVSNIGIRPTFETEPRAPRVETHIFDFEGDIYGQELELTFLAHLRDEKKFPSVDSLVIQINTDITLAREILSRDAEGSS